MRWFWGLLLIFFGLIFLGSNAGWWHASWQNLWQFWPLLLILWGAALLLRKWRFGWIIVLILFIGGLWLIFDYTVSPNPIFKNSQVLSKLKTSNFQANLSPGVSQAKIILAAGAGQIKIQDSTNALIEGSLISSGKPDLTVTNNNQESMAELKIKNVYPWTYWNRNDLDLKINNSIPIDLTLKSGASDINLDLSEIRLKNFDLEAGASSITLKLGDKIINGSKVKISTGASNLVISVSQNIGTKIIAKTGVSSKDFGSFKKIDDSTFKSENYDSKITKIEIDISAGASSISINQF